MTSSSSTNGSSEAALAASPADPRPRGRNGRVRRSHSRVARLLVSGGTIAWVGLAGLAPLLAGSVHRRTLLVLIPAGVLSLLATAVGLTMQGRGLRVGRATLAPLAFVLIPLIQSIPLPLGLRRHLDAAGTALLQQDALTAGRAWPLSLDPPSTRVEVGRAALGLIAFIIGYHLASGQSRRQLAARVIAVAGLVAVCIGFGHRMFGISHLYGLFRTTPRPLLVGPFVNPNHTAEFLELAAFVCLACSFQRATALNRIGWTIGAALCAGAATATLSRGAVVGLAAGTAAFAMARFAARRTDEGTDGRRAALTWGLIMLAIVVAGGIALGAGQLVERFKTDDVSTDVRLRLWKDALHVLAAHPFGIGRDAFDRVFPIYRSLKMPFPLRFAFIESEPLQMLIDCGWFFSLMIASAVALVVVAVVRFGRRDRIEAALLGGAAAVIAHNTVDFGLETAGVLLPFALIVGTVLGRCRTAGAPDRSERRSWPVVAAAVAAGIFGFASTAHGSADDFDALLKRAQSAPARLALIERAERAHPLDYYYALEKAQVLPLRGAEPGMPSPRLHQLNRALALCPTCEAVHVEVARNLWSIGLRRQALFEWRTAVELRPSMFSAAMGELYNHGAKPQDLAAVASSASGHMLELVAFLAAQGRVNDAIVVLDQATALGAPPAETLLARANVQFSAHRVDDAAQTMQQLRGLGIQDPRIDALDAKILVATRGDAAADEALRILDAAAARHPEDLAVQRERIEIVTRFKKWNAAERALEGFKQAEYRTHGSATNAHIWGARIATELGRISKAMDEYRIALGERPNDVTLWMEFGRVAASAGRIATARDAFLQAARLSPNNRDIAAAQSSLDVAEHRPAW